VVADMKRYKFQALVKLYPAGDGAPCPKLGPEPRRLVLRATNDETHRSQVFTALVSSYEDGPLGGPRQIVTLRLAGDDVGDYLGIGGRFDLWLGQTIGQGVITRRLFV
jgi:hypothetical protein